MTVSTQVMMVAREFDPYYEWLGIPPKDQPPNHYRLLGIELFESNRNVIDTAANRQMSFIKEYQAGAHSEVTQKLLNELSAARLCLLSAATRVAYDEQLRAKLKVQAAAAPVVPIPSQYRWRNASDAPVTSPDGRPPVPLATAIPFPAATPPDAQLAPERLDRTPIFVTRNGPETLRRFKVGLGGLVMAMTLMAAALAIVLAFVLSSSDRAETASPVDAVAQGPHKVSTKTGIAEPSVTEPTTVSEPRNRSRPSESNTEPSRSPEPVNWQPPPPTMPVPSSPKTTQAVVPPEPVIVVESAERAPASMKQRILSPAIRPSAEWPTTTAPPPSSPVETWEQADKRLRVAAEQASSPEEHQAVARGLLSLADKAILDSQIELAKRVVERALAAARKSESDDLVKQATLVWSELEQPSTDGAVERARQRLGEMKP